MKAFWKLSCIQDTCNHDEDSSADTTQLSILRTISTVVDLVGLAAFCIFQFWWQLEHLMDFKFLIISLLLILVPAAISVILILVDDLR